MTLRKYIFIAVVLVSSWLLSTIIRKLMSLFIKRNSKLLQVDPTNFSFLKNSASFVIYTTAFFMVIYQIPQFKDFTNKLVVGAGILTAIIGFASQKAFANIISGIFILFFKPYRVTDTIELDGGNKGVVEEITLRHTVIKDYENRRIIIPNSNISEATIINSSITDNRIRKHIDIGISYDSSYDRAKEILIEEVSKHRFFIDVRSDEDKANNVAPVLVRMIGHGESSIDIRAYAWSKNNDDAFVLKCDVLEALKKRFDAEGIEIPFPHRTVYVKKS
jgi:small-conductance mechanosensitive channel